MAFRPDLDALVLAILEQGPSHCYDISRRIDTEAGGEFRLQDGQLYPILHRLENEGWITSHWYPQEGKPARKVYSLTEDGRKNLEDRRQGWRRFSSAVEKLLVPAPRFQELAMLKHSDPTPTTIDGYLQDLRRRLEAELPSERVDDLVAETESHLREREAALREMETEEPELEAVRGFVSASHQASELVESDAADRIALAARRFVAVDRQRPPQLPFPLSAQGAAGPPHGRSPRNGSREGPRRRRCRPWAASGGTVARLSGAGSRR